MVKYRVTNWPAHYEVPRRIQSAGVIEGCKELCCTNRFKDVLPLPRTDLGYGLGDRYAKSRVAVEDGDANLDLGNLPFKVLYMSNWPSNFIQ
jgi:hypothetical protein